MIKAHLLRWPLRSLLDVPYQVRLRRASAACLAAGTFLIWLLFPIFSSSLQAADWKSLQPGFDYQSSDEPKVHLFRIDPKKFRLDLLLASDYGVSALTGERYRERSGALLVINGGFFDEVFHSLGLLQRHGQLVNPIRKAAWGIFGLDGPAGREPVILHPKDWKPQGVMMALQVGPRLVIDGKIPPFKESDPSKRSGVGITNEGLVILAVSEGSLMLREWAGILQKHCIQALNLDGGGSTQISVRLPNFSLEVEGATGVPNAVAVVSH